MTAETILTNAQIVLADETVHGSLVLRGGAIAEIGSKSTAPNAIDCEGDLLAPGLVELHTDNIERHLQPRPGAVWPERAAVVAHDAELASVGITTVFDALRIGSIPSGRKTVYGAYARKLTDTILELRAADALRISHFIHLRAEICSETLIAEIEEFHEGDRIGIISMMDHTPGQRQFVDTTQFRTYIRGKHGLSDDEMDAYFEKLLGIRKRYGDAHEQAAVAAARRFGAILASHDDTEDSHVETSAGYGMRLAEFPTTERAAHACQRHGIAVMMGAPNLLRGGSHSGNVAAETLEVQGHLDILSSDYAPSSLLMAAMRLADLRGNMATALGTVTAAPARAAGLADRGVLTIGKRADVIRIRRHADTPSVRGVWVKGARVG